MRRTAARTTCKAPKTERPIERKHAIRFLLEAFHAKDGKNRSGELAGKLRDLIVSGVLAPGFVFPNENEMCQQLGVGRGTLREAYSSLQALGLLTRNKSDGTYVNDYDTIVDKAPFDIVMGLSDYSDIFAFRQMIESETAKYAALRATEAELDDLAALLLEAEKSIGNYHDLQQHNHLFHGRIADCAHNHLLHSTYTSMRNAFKTLQIKNYYRLRLTAPEIINNAVAQHRQIYQAIRSGDAGTAKRLMEAHLVGSYRHTLENTSLDATFRPGGSG